MAAKRENPPSPAAPDTSSASPASPESGGDAPESSEGDEPEPGWDDGDEEDEKFTLKKFYAWLAEPKTTKKQIAIDVTPWIEWTKTAFPKDAAGKDHPDLLALRKAYAERKAALPE